MHAKICTENVVLEDEVLATVETPLPDTGMGSANNTALMLTPRGHLECKMFLVRTNEHT